MTFCPNCEDEIDPNSDTHEQRVHTTPCLRCNSDGHSACQH